MITATKLNEIEVATRRGDCLTKDTVISMITDVRALMAENVELYAALDKTKKAVSDATKMLDEVLK